MVDHVNGVVIDLSGADAIPADTAVLRTVFPGSNKPTGWNITFAGPGHPKTVALNNETSRKQLQKAALIERAQANGRSWKGDDLSTDDVRREFVEALVARMLSWTPVNFGDGVVEFTESDAAAPKRAVELLLKPKLGSYVSQCVDFLVEERTFMKGSASD